MEVDRYSEGFRRGGVVGFVGVESRFNLADGIGSEFITALETGGRGLLIDIGRSSNYDSGEGEESCERDGEANQHSEGEGRTFSGRFGVFIAKRIKTLLSTGRSQGWNSRLGGSR